MITKRIATMLYVWKGSIEFCDIRKVIHKLEWLRSIDVIDLYSNYINI